MAAATITNSTTPHKAILSIILSASRFLAQAVQPRECGSIILPQSRQGRRFMAQPCGSVFEHLDRDLCNNNRSRSIFRLI